MTQASQAQPQGNEEPRTGLNAISITLIVVVVIVIAVVGAQFAQQNAAPVADGNQAPGFTVTTFDGEEVSLESLAGNVVVVNFWASWCVPCEEEAPILQQAWEQYQDENFVMIGITHSDIRRDSLAFIDEYGLTYPNAPDPAARIYEAYGLTGVPESFVVAPDGELAYVLRGVLSEMTEDDFFAAIDALLEETT